MSDQNNNHNNLSTLILGVIIGASLTYLFTTKKGQKLKERLLVEGKDLLEEIGEKVATLEEEFLGKGEEAGEKLLEGAKDVEEKIEETVSEIPDHIEQIQKKGRRFFFRKHQASQES